MTNSPVVISLPGYAQNLPGALPTISSNESSGIDSGTTYTIPPVIWMFIFLIAGYVGLRMMLED